MNFKDKYLKYKSKYLKEKIKQKGGFSINFSTPISKSKKIDLLENSIMKLRRIPGLEDINIVMDDPMGFYLPLTDEWKTLLAANPLVYTLTMRELVFLESGDQIVGMGPSVPMDYFTMEEINAINKVLEEEINNLSKSSIPTSTASIPTHKYAYGTTLPDVYKYTHAYSTDCSHIGDYRFCFEKGFPKMYKQKLMERVVNVARTSSMYLTNLMPNASAELGFQLPQTQEWIELLLADPCVADLVPYHPQFRQMRFFEDEYNTETIGVRLKDNLPYWSMDEINELLEICNSEIRRMGLPSSYVRSRNCSTNIVGLPTSVYSKPSSGGIIITPSGKINKLGYGTVSSISSRGSNNLLISDYSDEVLDRYNHRKIKFKNPVKLSDKEYFMVKVIEKAKKNSVIRDLELYYGDEGGFKLPMSSIWRKTYGLRDDYRELKFMIEDNMIVGLRFIDDKPVWTYDEVDELLDIIESVIRKKLKKVKKTSVKKKSSKKQSKKSKK